MGKNKRTDVVPMNVPKKPLQSHSVASRCMCGLCGRRPDIEASGSAGTVTITARCCGQTETRTIPKTELFFTQRFFVAEGSDD